ncbi:MAG: TIGR00282 family metallophosphoesterase [Deltaproteobacteria bacterium]|nr:TIGR00282 family metallophosphoesterase [Deltaproteobacteria bacterium]
MQDSTIDVLFLGDVIGKPGRLAVKEFGKKKEADFLIINGENLAGGIGVTPKVAEEMFSCGVDAITTGNHVWKKKDILSYLSYEKRLLRPLNYPPETPGSGFTIIKKGEKAICIVNIEGRIFMNPLFCPFRTMIDFLEREGIGLPIIVDFHAEATSEKIAMGWFLDGKVSAVIGTHTHVQTSDEKILPNGTGYITDAGMTGPQDSVIGMDKTVIIERFLTQIPQKFAVGKDNVEVQGVRLKIDMNTKKCIDIQRVKVKVEI